MAVSSVLVGAAVSTVASLSTLFTFPVASKIRTPANASFGVVVTILLLPFLAAISRRSTHAQAHISSLTLDSEFVSLQPTHPNLLTILLMTAPRPGQPDYLFQTIESWLGALPEPDPSSNMSLSTASRVRMIVYTHFLTHDVFDAAQSHFTLSPVLGRKADHYIEWHRDPRGANRLDQRLHVARGLDYAATHGGSSAYVLLAEDDFPLCPDPGSEGLGQERKWSKTWNDFRRALVATNNAMPDLSPSSLDDDASIGESEETLAGHCGLFIATGGSGLAMRGFIAAKLPALLLGQDDSQGEDRDRRAAQGQFSVKHEDEGADTPDLVIQDCLRGRLEECRMCAPPHSARSRFPRGSARNVGGIRGDRYGKSGLAGTERLLQHHLGYNASTLPGRRYGKEEWACGWRQPFVSDSLFVHGTVAASADEGLFPERRAGCAHCIDNFCIATILISWACAIISIHSASTLGHAVQQKISLHTAQTLGSASTRVIPSLRR